MFPHNISDFILIIFRFENVLRYRGKAILLIRNPFRAILSWYKHETFGVHYGTETKVWQMINFIIY